MHAATVLQSRLIGPVLVEKGLITAEQLEQALEVQRETGERLGEVVIRKYGVTRLELASILAELWSAPAESEPSGDSLARTSTARVDEVAAASPGEGGAEEVRAQRGARAAEPVAGAVPWGAHRAGVEATMEAMGEPESIAPARAVNPAGYVALLPTVRGYRLVELPGPPPEIGSSLELTGGEFVVIGHGRSPLPLDRRSCAYLDHVHGSEPAHSPEGQRVGRI